MKIRRGEINLHVGDIDRAAGFYGEVFGFAECESGPGWRKLEAGDIVLTLFAAREKTAPRPPGEFCGMTADLICDDFDAAHERLRAAGATITHIGTWDEGRYLMFRDLDGIGWELLSN